MYFLNLPRIYAQQWGLSILKMLLTQFHRDHPSLELALGTDLGYSAPFSNLHWFPPHFLGDSARNL